MELKCICDSTEFSRLKFGGAEFRLQQEGEMALLKFAGFKPDMLACKECGRIVFRVPESQRRKN